MNESTSFPGSLSSASLDNGGTRERAWERGYERTTPVSFSCVCPVIDHKFRHHIVKVAVDPQTTLTMC